jgi:glycerophosphoryl diester phosphodiesterase
MNKVLLILFFFTSSSLFKWSDKDNDLKGTIYKLPEKGLCAHRGAMATHPENTLAAFHEAIKKGAHMIEFDVYLTKDNQPVVIHDATVDRTTNGKGRVSDLTLKEIRQLDAGSWKSPDFAGEKIPTLSETLQIMPLNIWLNIHLKGEDKVGRIVAGKLVEEKRLHQAFLACLPAMAAKARIVAPDIMICNMDRKETNWEYVKETINMKADFIQLRRDIYPEIIDYVKVLKNHGVRVNYYGTDSPEEIKTLFDYGVDFPLVDNISQSINVAIKLGIDPVQPVFRVK